MSRHRPDPIDPPDAPPDGWEPQSFEVVEYLERVRDGWWPGSVFNYPTKELQYAMNSLGVVKRMTLYRGCLTRWVYLGPDGIERRGWACHPSEAADAILKVGREP